MAMATTCPACHTRFRVTSEQMVAHGGDVRCGRCAKIFKAHVYLERELEELQHEGQARLPFEEPGSSKQAPFRVCCSASAEYNHGEDPCDLTIAPSPPVGEGWGEGVTEEPAAPSLDETPVEEEAERLLQAMDALLAESPVESGAAEPAALEPQFVSEPLVVAFDDFDEIEEEPKKRRFFWLWSIGALLLLASLGVQGLYFFRSDLAARHPEFKPYLQQLCGVLKCGIRLPADPDLLGIDTSNLEADPQQSNLVALNAILRNRARLAQEYPQLELTLTDTQDKMIARRIFTPGEYAKDADLDRGMTPNEEVTVKLNLDLGDLKAAGYRVFLFYPH